VWRDGHRPHRLYGYSTTGSYEAARAQLEKKNGELAAVHAELEYGNKAMLRVLDNVDQGLLTVDSDGHIVGRWSAAVERSLGVPQDGMLFETLLRPHDAVVADSLRLGLADLKEGFMPAEVTLAQLPARISARGRELAVHYAELPDGGLLVKLSDVTDQVARARAEAAQQQTLAIFQQFRRDRAGVVTFLQETESLMGQLRERAVDVTTLKRNLHTVKGSAAIIGLTDLAARCHHLEDVLADIGRLDGESCRDLCTAWSTLREDVAVLIGHGEDQTVEVSRAELATLARSIDAGLPPVETAEAVRDLARDPVRPQLDRLAEQARALAARLGKGSVVVDVDAPTLRAEREHTGALLSSLVHVVRNALDHGIETADERRAAGKPDDGRVVISAARDDEGLRIEIRDDGRGIAWERVAAAARKRGLPTQSRAELEAALFADGVSTADEVTDISGRGIGTSAVAAEVQRLGGSITIDSEVGGGTTFRFVIPLQMPRAVPRAA